MHNGMKTACTVAAVLFAAFAAPVRAQWSTTGTNIYNTNTGNVGIGNNNPGFPLSFANVNGDKISLFGNPASAHYGFGIQGSLLQIHTDTQSADIAFGSGTSASFTELMRIKGNGRIGIGTTSPSARLHTHEPALLGSVLGNYQILERLSGKGGNVIARNVWLLRDAAGTDWATARLHDGISIDASFQTPGVDTRVWFERDPMEGIFAWGTSTGTWMTLNNGALGIGTKTPSSALHVVGNVTVTGNISAKYQDIAEWVPTERHISPGSVVILDPRHSNQVLPSGRAYDTRVAGVVSSQPGLILGEAGDDKVKVATTGRVKIKVDASKAAIEIGDLLVTSDHEGMAMKSIEIDLGGVKIHRPGTIVAKALEPLASGEGEILALLTLQ